jgi:hypothetical protein
VSLPSLSAWELRQIGSALRAGRAVVEGRVTLGLGWPDDPHAWIVTIYGEWRTVHVPVDQRPTWGRYLRPEGREVRP